MQDGEPACSANPLGHLERGSLSDPYPQAEATHAPATASVHGEGGTSATPAASAVGSSPVARGGHVCVGTAAAQQGNNSAHEGPAAGALEEWPNSPQQQQMAMVRISSCLPTVCGDPWCIADMTMT
jgi:hypothetical protein